jgi:hypothetical protein
VALKLLRFGGHSTALGPSLHKEEFIVPKTRPAYLPESRHQIIELARTGRSPEELA